MKASPVVPTQTAPAQGPRTAAHTAVREGTAGFGDALGAALDARPPGNATRSARLHGGEPRGVPQRTGRARREDEAGSDAGDKRAVGPVDTALRVQLPVPAAAVPLSPTVSDASEAPVATVNPRSAWKPPARDLDAPVSATRPPAPEGLLPPADAGLPTPWAHARKEVPALDAPAGVRNVDTRQVPDTLLVMDGTAVRVGPHLACIRVVTEDAAALEVRLKVHDGTLHVDARGPGAGVLHGRVNDLVTALRGDGLQLGTFRHDDGGSGTAWQSPRDGTGDAPRPETAPAQTRARPSAPGRGPGRYA